MRIPQNGLFWRSGNSCHKTKDYVVTIVNKYLIMIRKSAWAVVILILAVAASPAAAFAIPAGATMMPMHGGSGQTGGQSSGCSCAMPMQASPLVRPESPSRPASQQETSPCNGAAQQIVSTTGPAGRVRGIRKIYAKNVLDHPERTAVYDLIVRKPGIDRAGIADELGMNSQTLRYHLDLIESFAKIIVVRDHGIVRYYENHGRYNVIERNVLVHQWNPTASGILSLIQSQPGITQSEIAVQFAVTAPTVRWYMQRFRDDGIITARHEGRYTRYALTNEASRYAGNATEKTAAVALAI
jgi:DNA-binding transcriptional ArsR family regulator